MHPFKNDVWLTLFISASRLRPGEQPLWKKSCGHLIHVSDFVNIETGRLVVRNDSGEVVRDARKIIYLGKNHQ